MEIDNIKLVRLKVRTYDRVAQHGKYGDTFDDIVNRLVDEIEKVRKK